jgi:hypothetical protein
MWRFALLVGMELLAIGKHKVTMMRSVEEYGPLFQDDQE